MKRAWLVLSCLLALAACAVDPKARPEPTLEPLPTVAHPKAEIPKDRDAAAVLSAVGRLDPCALLEPREAGLPGVPAGTELDPVSPFACELDMADYRDRLALEVVELPAEERREMSTEPIDGMRSYRVGDQGACAVSLPISFRFAVRIIAEFDGDAESCGLAKAVAGQVVARLGAPEQVETEPRWDACSVLATAPNVPKAAAAGWDVSTCDSAETTVDLHLAGNGVVDTNDTVGGTPVNVGDDRGRCSISWLVGDLIASAKHPSCDEAKKVAGRAMEVLATPPPAGEPQRPVLYPWDEPDVPYPGGCRYVADPTCQPYVEVPVPEGEPVEVLRHALADPNVHCALAADIGPDVFDADLTPVTAESKCHFVGAGAPTVSTYLQAGSTYVPGSGETEVGGRPAELVVEEKYGYLLVALAENLPGDVVLIVSMRADPDGEVEEHALRTVAEEILTRHFG